MLYRPAQKTMIIHADGSHRHAQEDLLRCWNLTKLAATLHPRSFVKHATLPASPNRLQV